MLKVLKLDDRALPPTVANAGEDLGFDIYALEDTPLPPHTPVRVRTGIAVHFEKPDAPQEKFGLLVRDRSSMASKGVFATGGVIDAGYRGELLVLLSAYAPASAEGHSYLIKAGDKIAQLIPVPVLTGGGVSVVASLSASARGEGGFGSTGK
ncbi:MAG: dUTP diphosphatase [Acidobacteria bacterium]|jgi:dUTP pyrophosphatase|nr:dUTP diphosphatase [Acidobacteriota bacterium]